MQLFWEAEADIFVCFKLNPTFFVEEFEQKKMKNRSGKSRAGSRSGGERKVAVGGRGPLDLVRLASNTGGGRGLPEDNVR